MRANDLTGMIFGTLKVLKFDSERHENDKKLKKEGKINRVRRYYICESLLSGEIVSVRGENLVSGNTSGTVSEKGAKISKKLKQENEFKYDEQNNCYIIYAHNTKNKFLIDVEDYELVKQHCWYETNYGYLMTRLNKDRQIFLHRYLMFGENDIFEDLLVDHKSRKRYDNRRSNLRICGNSGNSINISTPSNNTSGHIGVSYYKPGNKWRAWVTVNGKFISLGYYSDINDAIQARIDGERKYYGEFAPSIN